MPSRAIADQLNSAYHVSSIDSNKHITVSKPKQNTRANLSVDKIPRTRSYLQWRNNVSDALYDAGMEHEADLWNDCQDPALCFTLRPEDDLNEHHIGACACSENPSHFAKAIVPTCDLRVCPDCAARQSARLLNRYMPLVETYAKRRGKYRLNHLILTTKFALRDGDIKTRLRVIYKRLNLFLKRIGSRGSIVAAEFGENGYKLHFHCLVYMPYVHFTKISQEWIKETGNAPVTYIRQVVRDDEVYNPDRQQDMHAAIAETLKYSVKFFKQNDDGTVEYLAPDLVPLLLDALKGTRRVRTTGVFYSIEFEEEKNCCPECGASLTMLSRDEWHIFRQTGWSMVEYRAALDASLVNLKLANKSSPGERGETGGSPPKQPELPGMVSTGTQSPKKRF